MSEICGQIFIVSFNFEVFVLGERTRWFDSTLIRGSAQITCQQSLFLFASDICLVLVLSTRINAISLLDATRKFLRPETLVIIKFLQTSQIAIKHHRVLFCLLPSWSSLPSSQVFFIYRLGLWICVCLIQTFQIQSKLWGQFACSACTRAYTNQISIALADNTLCQDLCLITIFIIIWVLHRVIESSAMNLLLWLE